MSHETDPELDALLLEAEATGRALAATKRAHVDDVIDREAAAALRRAGVRSLPLALPHLRERLRAEEVDGRLVIRPVDERGRPVLLSPLTGSEDPAVVLEEYVRGVLFEQFPELRPGWFVGPRR